jgi:hypothetical protein
LTQRLLPLTFRLLKPRLQVLAFFFFGTGSAITGGAATTGLP